MSGTKAGARTKAGSRALSGGRSLHSTSTPPAAPGAAPVISGIAVVPGQTTVSISWSLDQPSQGWFEYGLTVSYGSESVHEASTTFSSHTQGVSGLTPNTSYYYLIHAVNADGQSSTSGPWLFTTQPSIPSGTGAPVISGIVISNVTSTGFQVSWNLDQPCQGWIEYGTANGGPYGTDTTHETSFLYSTHTQTITGLAASTTYYFKIVATNAAAQVTRSSQQSQATSAVVVTPPTPPPGGGGTYPATSTLTTGTVPSGAQTLPSVGVLTADATTPGGTTHYMRISSGSQGGHYYATSTPWNSDGTRFWDHYSGVLLRTDTWASLGSRSVPADGPAWAWTDPNRMYGMLNQSTGSWGYYNMVTGAAVPLYTISGYSLVRNRVFGDGGHSRDDRYFVFRTESPDRLVVLDRKTGGVADSCSIVGTMSLTNRPDNVRMSASGAYVVVNWENNNGTGSNQGVWKFSRDFSSGRNLNNNGDHGDCGYDAAGNDIYVCSYAGNGSNLQNIYSYRLDQSTSALDVGRLLPQASGYQFQQGHVSLQCRDLNGWAYLTSFTHSLTQPGRGQIIAVPTDGSAFAAGAGIRVFGWHRSDATIPPSTSDPTGLLAYARQPQGSPNMDGTKVAVRSKWAMNDAVDQSFYGFVFSA